MVNPLMAAALLVGLIWCAVAALRMPLLPACLTILLVSVCFGYAFVFNLQIGPYRWTLDRLGLLLLVGAFLLQRHLGRTTRRPLGLSEWLLVVFLAWITISLYTHDFRHTFGHSATPTWRWLTGYLVPCLFFWIARQSPTSDRYAGWLQALLVLFGIYLAVTGLCEVFEQWALVFPKHIADPTVGIHFGRARGPMVTSVTYGLYLGTCFVCLWAARERWGRLGWPVALLLSPLFLAGIYYSYTRSVWMGAGLGLVTVLALTTRGWTRIGVLGGMLAAVCVVGAAKMDSIVSFQREQSAEDTQNSASGRLSFAYVSWQMFLDHSVAGVGFGQFPDAKMSYLSDRKVDLRLEDIRPLVHHNTLLCLLTESGGVGLALFLTLLGSWARDSYRLWRSAATPPWARRQAVVLLGVLGVYVCQLLFHELSYSTQDNCLIFLLAGAAAAMRPLAAGEPDQEAALSQNAAMSPEATRGLYKLDPQS